MPPAPAVADNVHQVIYSSAAVTPFTEPDLGSLLLRARANNARLGVSGLLLHHEGSFLQVLEGKREVLDPLFRTISLDKRHDRVVKLLDREVDERHFADWKMGFVSAASIAKQLPGYTDYLRHRGEVSKAADAADRVLAAFREGRFRSHVAT
ncbi:MAG: BLUF domain-containing protein [Polyangiaceae bacterium]